ncbi:hypothetical protein Dda_7556 [Drechslerella dactyloides]|uniref:Uncharacterized protein n=1 Tax=Drechslerella dactyloides TaxID=74499 RepID=A0AAD6NGY0_DREDA|nr:hypothetical protein Dda_7556 [Drechslerella dactyloides]
MDRIVDKAQVRYEERTEEARSGENKSNGEGEVGQGGDDEEEEEEDGVMRWMRADKSKSRAGARDERATNNERQ